MKKAVLAGPYRLAFEDRELPSLQPHEVLIRMRHASLCSSDVGQWRNGTSRAFGHDAAGVVAATGPAVTLVRPGDAVTPIGSRPCGSCAECSAGTPLRCLARTTNRPDQSGWFAEAVVVHERNAIPIPPGATVEDGALLEAPSTGIHGIRTLGVSPEALVPCWGAGWMAWGQIAAAAAIGARPVVIATNAARIALALRFGALEALHPDDPNLDARLRALNGGEAPRYLIDATGGRVPEPLTAIQRVGGTAATIGLLGIKEGVRLEDFLYKQQTLVAIIGIGTNKIAALELIAAGNLDMKPCVSHRFPFQELERALILLRDDRHAVTKIMIDFD